MLRLHLRPSTPTIVTSGNTILEAAQSISSVADDAMAATVWHITITADPGDKEVLHVTTEAPTWELAIARFKTEVLGV